MGDGRERPVTFAFQEPDDDAIDVSGLPEGGGVLVR